MMKLLPHKESYALFALIVSGGLLCGAWFFQYVLGYAPCTMCYWQRHAHKVVIGVAALTLVYGRAKGETPLLLNLFIVLAFLGSVYMALWHAGVEYGVFEELKICAAGPTSVDGLSGLDLIESLSAKLKPPACSDVVWSFLGLSMAGWNAVVSLLAAAIGGLVFRRQKA